jgi:hypothetical protein
LLQHTSRGGRLLEFIRKNIQAVVGHGFIPFGNAQKPTLSDYADGVDTMYFLNLL